MITTKAPDDWNVTLRVANCFTFFGERFLLLLRNDGRGDKDVYGLPGGTVEDNETALQGMQREHFEETGIKGDFCHLRTLFIRSPGRDLELTLFHVQLETEVSVILDPTEHKSYCWVTPQEALELPLMRDLKEFIEGKYYLE